MILLDCLMIDPKARTHIYKKGFDFMEKRKRGMNHKGFAPELCEAINFFNLDLNKDLHFYPDLVMPQMEGRPLTEDEKKDTMFVKRLAREHARIIFTGLNQLYDKRSVSPDETFPMFSWNMVIAYDNAIYNFRMNQANDTHIYPIVWELNSHLAMILVIRSLARAGLLYFTDKNFDSVRDRLREDLSDVIMDIDKYNFVPVQIQEFYG